MKKMEFIRIATIACLALTSTARAEQPFDDEAFVTPDQQVTSTTETPAPQQLALADPDDIQSPQQQANSNTEADQASQQLAFADAEQAPKQLALADTEQPQQQLATADTEQPQQQLAPANTAQAQQQLALADTEAAQAPQQQTIASTDDFQAPQQEGIVQTTSAPPQPSLASAESRPAPEQQKLSRKELVAIANASDPEKKQTADAISAILHGKNPEKLNRDINQAENNIEADKSNATASESPKTTATEAVSDSSPANLTGIKHFIIRGKGEFAYSMDCYIKAKDVLCKGSLRKQPANYKSYESTLIGQISGSVIKGNVTSYTKIAGSSAGKDCDTDNETNWPMTITLNADHEALMDTGPVKSFINTTGSANCSGTSEQSYPGKKISMKWRAIG